MVNGQQSSSSSHELRDRVIARIQRVKASSEPVAGEFLLICAGSLKLENPARGRGSHKC